MTTGPHPPRPPFNHAEMPGTPRPAVTPPRAPGPPQPPYQSPPPPASKRPPVWLFVLIGVLALAIGIGGTLLAVRLLSASPAASPAGSAAAKAQDYASSQGFVCVQEENLNVISVVGQVDRRQRVLGRGSRLLSLYGRGSGGAGSPDPGRRSMGCLVSVSLTDIVTP